jgi:PKHD-type hydroxylase
MNYLVTRLLQSEEADGVVRELARRTFADGRLTAHGRAREVKNNLQFAGKGPEIDELHSIVVPAFQRSKDFNAFAIPRRMVSPIFSRYDPGMEYGAHIDNAMMAGLRTDLAVTLFLSRPETYDGGELVIHLPAGQQEVKLDAGEAIIYPAGTVHHVSPVTRGARLAAITWVQSVVRDERLRTILYDLHLSTHEASAAKDPALSMLLGKSYHNLLRYAAES